jgi:RND family efflux transporter MFP subunit
MDKLQIKQILFATDFLESSRLALDYAVAFAHHFKATVVLLHAVELSTPAEEAEAVTGRPSLSRKAAEERLEAFASGLRRTGLEVKTLVEDGTPCQVILDAVKAYSPDLLVLGVHGDHRGVGHLVIGSNTEKILLSVACPTLSVGAHVFGGTDLTLKLQEIVYCSDFTPEAAAAASYALLLGKEFNVRVDVCHLAPTPFEHGSESANKLAADYCNALRRTIPDTADLWCTPAFHIKHGLALDQILKRAEAETAGLIVLGVRAESQLARHLHTSFAYQLLTRAACPVLSVPEGPDRVHPGNSGTGQGKRRSGRKSRPRKLASASMPFIKHRMAQLVTVPGRRMDVVSQASELCSGWPLPSSHRGERARRAWSDLRMKTRHFLRYIAPLCGVALSLAGCGRSDSKKEQPPAAAVALVQRGNISHLLSLAGQFQAYQVVDVHAKVSGYVRHIYVDIGDRVHAGEILATLEVPELNAQYRSTESEALRSQYAITAAQHEVSRAKALHTAVQANYDRLAAASAQRPGLIAAQELDNARSQAEATQEQLDAALAQLSGAKQAANTATADQQRVGDLEAYTRVIAPLNGVVAWRYADTGVLIQEGTNSETQAMPLIKLAQSDLLRLRVPVPEDAVRYVHIGDPMQIRVDALDDNFSGKVVRFTRNLDLDTRTMETEVDVPNPTLKITPGMYANTYLRLAHRENVLTIPIAAVQTTGNKESVLVLNANNQVETRSLQLGLRGSLLVEVTNGLQAGDRVVDGDASSFHAGETVTPRVQQEPASDIMHEEGGVTESQQNNGGGN